MENVRTCEKVFYILCIFVAISLTVWCTYEYHLDHDVTDIVLRKFQDTPNDILPSITLCKRDPFESYNMECWEAKVIIYQSLISGDDRSRSREKVSITKEKEYIRTVIAHELAHAYFIEFCNKEITV